MYLSLKKDKSERVFFLKTKKKRKGKLYTKSKPFLTDFSHLGQGYVAFDNSIHHILILKLQIQSHDFNLLEGLQLFVLVFNDTVV